MKRSDIKVLLGMTLAGILAGVFCLHNVFGGAYYTRSVFYRDMVISNFTAIDTLTWIPTNGGTYNSGSHTIYYRVSGTNTVGRLPVSGVITASFGGDAVVTNAVWVQWGAKDGINSYVVERSTDAAIWTNWYPVSPTTTNFIDAGTNNWTVGVFTSTYDVIPSPSLDFRDGTVMMLDNLQIDESFTAPQVNVGPTNVSTPHILNIFGTNSVYINLGIYGAEGTSAETNITGYGENIALTGTRDVWANPTNITVADTNAYAFASGGSADGTHIIRASQFGFSIPSDATVIGVEVSLLGCGVHNDPKNVKSRIWNNGAASSTNFMAWSAYTPVREDFSYGGASTLYGLSSLTPTEVNAPEFSIDVWSDVDLDSSGLYLTEVRTKITYIDEMYSWTVGINSNRMLQIYREGDLILDGDTNYLRSYVGLDMQGNVISNAAVTNVGVIPFSAPPTNSVWGTAGQVIFTDGHSNWYWGATSGSGETNIPPFDASPTSGTYGTPGQIIAAGGNSDLTWIDASTAGETNIPPFNTSTTNGIWGSDGQVVAKGAGNEWYWRTLYDAATPFRADPTNSAWGSDDQILAIGGGADLYWKTLYHNTFSDLQGGNGSDEYYHLNNEKYTNLIASTPVFEGVRLTTGASSGLLWTCTGSDGAGQWQDIVTTSAAPTSVVYSVNLADGWTNLGGFTGGKQFTANPIYLTNSGNIWFFGGWTDGSSNIYCSNTNDILNVTNTGYVMPQAVQYGHFIVITNNIYAFGGSGDTSIMYCAVSDPTAWSGVSEQLPYSGYYNSAFIHNGFVLAAGGVSATQVEACSLSDPLTWNLTNGLPNNLGYGGAYISYGTNSMICGGYGATYYSNLFIVSEAEPFTWSISSDGYLPQTYGWANTGVILSNRAYVVGGTLGGVNTNGIMFSDPDDVISWDSTTLNIAPGGAYLQWPINTVIVDGYMYLFGSGNSTNFYRTTNRTQSSPSNLSDDEKRGMPSWFITD